jgi:hypothetical protein
MTEIKPFVFNTREIDEYLNNLNEHYKSIKQFEDDEHFDKIPVFKLSDYLKTLRMRCNTDDELKQVNEYEKDNDDYLKSLSKKEKKLINKQRNMKMLKNNKL